MEEPSPARSALLLPPAAGLGRRTEPFITEDAPTILAMRLKAPICTYQVIMGTHASRTKSQILG